MQRVRPMGLATARACFDALAARGRAPVLEGLTGTWEIDLSDAPEGDKTWFLDIDDGNLAVRNEPLPGGKPQARLEMRESDFVRLATGSGHENLITAVLRGAVTVDGDLRFAQRLQAVLPLPAET